MDRISKSIQISFDRLKKILYFIQILYYYIVIHLDLRYKHTVSFNSSSTAAKKDFKRCNSHVFSLLLTTPLKVAIDIKILLANADFAWRRDFVNYVIILI